ncbi:MAG TPA: S8 family serine peptidase [Acidobacteriota bacterium]|nr:S8 family serine peptidase [Acidobacteriota bacterium]
MSIKKSTVRHVSAAILIAVLGVSFAEARVASEFVAGYQPLRPVVKPTGLNLSPQAPPGHVVIKFRRGTPIDGSTVRLAGTGTDVVRQIFAAHGLAQPMRMIAGDVEEMRVRRLAAEDRVHVNLPDMSLYYRHPITDPALAVQIIAEVNARDEVEIAYFEPRPEVAQYPADASAGVPHSPYALAATTPSWESSQDYIESAPGGVDARGAWTLPGGDGTGTQVIDIEYGWQLTHEDLSKGATAILIGENPSDNDHGTAVLGEMAADRNLIGMTGIAYNADIGASSVATMSFAEAVDLAAAASDPGDCILIELHSPGPRYDFEGREDQRGYVPMEYFQANFDALLNAWAQGAIVCEAAGNGAENLDDPIYESLFDTTVRNSHAIMCGAGNPPASTSADRSKLGFSNWGARVNLQGYGTLVYSLGYGDLYDGGSRDSWYTDSFGGTSSASPIVTGAVLCLSGVYQQMLGTVVDADSIRNLLVATGSPQQQPLLIYHIGPRPDLGTALDLLFDPTDTIWYGELELDPGTRGAIPISLSNSHPVADIYLPFDLSSGNFDIQIDSLTRGPRTLDFEKIQTVYDNRFFDQIAYLVRADAGGGTPYLQGGSGVIAYLWVTAPGAALPGQAVSVDSTWLGTSTHLRLVSYFDDGYPNAFTAGTVTITGLPCDCSFHGDLNGDGIISILDVVMVVDVAFRSGAPAPTDPACPHATRADYNCDGMVNVLDVVMAVDIAFRDGPPPCNPCEE